MARLGRSRPRKVRSGGRSYGRGASMKTKGLSALERRIRSLSSPSDIDAGLRAEASDGKTYGRSGERFEHRSAADNAKIWNRHRRDGRNPFRYDEKTGLKIWRDGANGVIDNHPEKLDERAEDVANFMRKEVVKNIKSEQGMKPLEPRYAAWKRKKFGTSILVRSGQLLRALKAIVIK